LKTIAIDEKTWRKLKEIREKLGAQSYNELINILIEEWRIKKIKESVESINTDIPASMVDKYLAKIKSGKEEKQ